MALTHNVLAIFTVTASLLYNIYLTDSLEVFWLFFAIFTTLTGIHTDFRADWGLILQDEGDPCLRGSLSMPRWVYPVVMSVDIVFNVAWVLTISNNIALSARIDPVYFLMIISYIELVRKGIWLFMRVEDDHSTNLAALNTMAPDTEHYTALK